jgi:hypothetical protein
VALSALRVLEKGKKRETQKPSGGGVGGISCRCDGGKRRRFCVIAFLGSPGGPPCPTSEEKKDFLTAGLITCPVRNRWVDGYSRNREGKSIYTLHCGPQAGQWLGGVCVASIPAGLSFESAAGFSCRQRAKKAGRLEMAACCSMCVRNLMQQINETATGQLPQGPTDHIYRAAV